MPELDHKAGTATFPVLVIGDSGGPHVQSRALAMAQLGYEIHTVTPRPSGVVKLNEIGPVAERFGNGHFMRPGGARRVACDVSRLADRRSGTS